MSEEARGCEHELERCVKEVYAVLNKVREEVHRAYSSYRAVEVEDFKEMVERAIKDALGLPAYLKVHYRDLAYGDLPENPEITFSLWESCLYVDCGEQLGMVRIPMFVLERARVYRPTYVLDFYAPESEERVGGYELLDDESADWILIHHMNLLSKDRPKFRPTT